MPSIRQRVALVALCVCLVEVHRAVGQTQSEFQSNAGSLDWFNPLNWSAGVPHAPGDAAAFTVNGSPKKADLTAPAQLGQLLFSGPGSAEIAGTQTLTFDRPGDSPAVIQVIGPNHMATVRPMLGIAVGERLQLAVGSGGQLTLVGGFAPGAGAAAIEGAGVVTLSGGEAGWQGPLTVAGGTIVVNHASGLGGTNGQTFLNGGTLRLNQAVNEPIVFGGGTLATSAARDMNGALLVPAGQTAQLSGPLRLNGGSSGDGDVNFELTAEASVSSLPLAHAGRLAISSTQSVLPRLTISVDNSYHGETTITRANVIVNTPGGLGTTDEGTVLKDGQMRLHANSRERIEAVNSTVSLLKPSPSADEERYEGHISLQSSTLNGYQPDSFSSQRYAMVNPIVLAGGNNRIEPPSRVMRILGGITGEGNLLINAPAGLIMESQLAFDGEVELRGGPIRFTKPGGFQGTTLVRNGGQLIAEADQHFAWVQSGERDTECCNPFARVAAAPGATLMIDKLRINEGSLSGDIRTSGDVEFFGFASPRAIRNLSSGLNVRLHAGQVFVEDTDAQLGATTGAMIVGRESAAVIVLQDHLTYEADFHLENGSGFSYGGALRTDPGGSADSQAILNGDIYLGDQGAYLGDGGGLRLQGQMYGGDLNLVDGANLSIAGRTAAYTGETRVGQFSQLSVSGGGRLANTSKIELNANGSRLAVDIDPGESVADRIADGVPIEMAGGELGVWPTAYGVRGRERVGEVHLVRGQSNLKGGFTNRGREDSAVDLVIGELTREPGALMSASYYNDRHGSPFLQEADVYAAGPILEQAPALVHGVLPAWMMTHRGYFATLSGNRMVDFQNYQKLATANETSILQDNNGGAITSDRTFHGISAVGYFSGLNLNGHTLTIGSGGVFNATISNGEIRPGQYANGELILYNSVINASLADNGVPTSVVYTGTNEIRGANSYSGVTYVTGEPGEHTDMYDAGSLPSGGDVELSGGTLGLRATADYVLGRVAIRDHSQLHVNCCGNGATLTAERIDFESGFLSAKLAGDMPIEKSTDGMATIGGREYASYNGDVAVREGLLLVENYPSLGAASVTVHPGGRLALGPNSAPVPPAGSPEPSVTLNGGALYGGGTQNYEYVNLRGDVNVIDDSQVYLVNALQKTQSGSDIIIEGALNVAPGKTLELVGWGNSRFGRWLLATEGVHLAEGAVLAGDGGLRGTVEIADGAILSPGSLSSGVSVGELSMVRELSLPNLTPTLIWGEGGVYRWEINDLDGKAGAIFGEGWDLMRVDGTLNVAATAQSPFIIQMNSLGDFGLSELSLGEIVSLPILQANMLVGFDPAKFVLDVSGLGSAGSAGRVLAAGPNAEFSLRQEGNSIMLDVVGIPEPSGVFAAIVAAVAIASRGRAAGNSKRRLGAHGAA